MNECQSEWLSVWVSESVSERVSDMQHPIYLRSITGGNAHAGDRTGSQAWETCRHIAYSVVVARYSVAYETRDKQ